MSLDVTLKKMVLSEIYTDNITHNLGYMAQVAGIYEALWHPEKINAKYAKDLIPYLESGLSELVDNPEGFKEFNPKNGWGSYETLVSFTENYLQACKANPDAEIHVCR